GRADGELRAVRRSTLGVLPQPVGDAAGAGELPRGEGVRARQRRAPVEPASAGGVTRLLRRTSDPRTRRGREESAARPREVEISLPPRRDQRARRAPG